MCVLKTIASLFAVIPWSCETLKERKNWLSKQKMQVQPLLAKGVEAKPELLQTLSGHMIP